MEELKSLLNNLVTPGKKDRRYLVSLLQDVQRKLGYIPDEAMLEIASLLKVSSVTVWGVATFYNQFRFTPPGKHQVNVCMGTACHMAGGSLVMDAMARELEIESGGITGDRQFSLDRVACVGCCALAPVVVIGDEVHPRMNSQKVEEVLVTIKAENQEAQIA
jgi:NADH-quinone oxidoreductase subunit E